MRTFKLVRKEDFSGVSGTGEVAEGVQFKNGKCAMNWDTKTSSTAIYESVQDLINIHGHEGRTVVVFDDTSEVVTDVKEVGLLHKYDVYKVNDAFPFPGELVTDWVFVLNPRTDVDASEALWYYAEITKNNQLSSDIVDKLREIEG